MTFRAFGVLTGLAQRAHLLEFCIAVRTNIFINRHDESPSNSVTRFLVTVKVQRIYNGISERGVHVT